MLELHLALLGAFKWTGPYGPLEREYRFEIGGDVYEGGKGSRTALRGVLNIGQPFAYACRMAEIVLACEPIRSYEVPSRRHYPKVLDAEEGVVVESATRSAQSALRREYREYESDYSIEPGTPVRELSNRAFRHGLFAAVIAGPMVSPMEWLGLLIEVESGQSPDDLNDATAVVMEEYNGVASRLLEGKDAFIEDVAEICGTSDDGEAIVDWYRGFTRGMSLRAGEWKKLIERDDGNRLVQPLAFIEEVINTPGKRDWLANAELRAGLPLALGIMAVRLWERTRAVGHSEPKGAAGELLATGTVRRATPKISPNAPCPCGSGKKYKRCCSTLRAV